MASNITIIIVERIMKMILAIHVKQVIKVIDNPNDMLDDLYSWRVNDKWW